MYYTLEFIVVDTIPHTCNIYSLYNVFIALYKKQKHNKYQLNTTYTLHTRVHILPAFLDQGFMKIIM